MTKANVWSHWTTLDGRSLRDGPSQDSRTDSCSHSSSGAMVGKSCRMCILAQTQFSIHDSVISHRKGAQLWPRISKMKIGDPLQNKSLKKWTQRNYRPLLPSFAKRWMASANRKSRLQRRLLLRLATAYVLRHNLADNCGFSHGLPNRASGFFQDCSIVTSRAVP
jgi:hypothetical protein